MTTSTGKDENRGRDSRGNQSTGLDGCIRKVNEAKMMLNKAMTSIHQTYDDAFRDLKEIHKVGTGKEVLASLDLPLCKSAYNWRYLEIRKTQATTSLVIVTSATSAVWCRRW